MGRSSSILLVMALFCVSAASRVAAQAQSTRVGADMAVAQASDRPEPDAFPGSAPYPIGGPGLQVPPPPFAFAPPPCIRPMIIQVGRGLAHAAKTKIVYGARPPCG